MNFYYTDKVAIYLSLFGIVIALTGLTIGFLKFKSEMRSNSRKMKMVFITVTYLCLLGLYIFVPRWNNVSEFRLPDSMNFSNGEISIFFTDKDRGQLDCEDYYQVLNSEKLGWKRQYACFKVKNSFIPFFTNYSHEVTLYYEDPVTSDIQSKNCQFRYEISLNYTFCCLVCDEYGVLETVKKL
jgi:hypothetical protein